MWPHPINSVDMHRRPLWWDQCEGKVAHAAGEGPGTVGGEGGTLGREERRGAGALGWGGQGGTLGRGGKGWRSRAGRALPRWGLRGGGARWGLSDLGLRLFVHYLSENSC